MLDKRKPEDKMDAYLSAKRAAFKNIEEACGRDFEKLWNLVKHVSVISNVAHDSLTEHLLLDLAKNEAKKTAMTYDELEETVRTFGDGADFNSDTGKAEEKTTVALEATEDKKRKKKNKIDKPKAPHGGGGRGGGKKGYIYYTDNQSWHPYTYKGYKGDKGKGIGKGKGKGGYWVKNGGGRGGG